MKMTIKFLSILAVISLLAHQNSVGQGWDNPANKYNEAYKEYLDGVCPIPADTIQHFVYFAKDRKEIINHPLLSHSRFVGAQVMYSWKDLEPRKGHYDFSIIEKDYAYLNRHGKKLFVQLQDVTFYPKNKAVPNYMLSDEYDGGVVEQFYEGGASGGWVAKRWNRKVRERFALFLLAFGEAFDGKIEGINLQETAIDIKEEADPSFSEESYVNGVKENMLALKKAFPTSTTMLYANFVPGEWLPWEDKGYLRGLYEYGEEIGVGLGAPDLMVTRKAQLNHPLRMMHEGTFSVPLGIAIQDGNYIGKTGADSGYDEHTDKGGAASSIVPLLHAFAKDFLRVDYMFWVNQKPYFSEHVISCFSSDN